METTDFPAMDSTEASVADVLDRLETTNRLLVAVLSVVLVASGLGYGLFCFFFWCRKKPQPKKEVKSHRTKPVERKSRERSHKRRGDSSRRKTSSRSSQRSQKDRRLSNLSHEKTLSVDLEQGSTESKRRDNSQRESVSVPAKFFSKSPTPPPPNTPTLQQPAALPPQAVPAMLPVQPNCVQPDPYQTLPVQPDPYKTLTAQKDCHPPLPTQQPNPVPPPTVVNMAPLPSKFALPHA